jgi:hypothetical protein
MYYAACQARFALSTRGGPMTGVYYAADSPNLFRDEFSQFWLTNNLFYTWQFLEPSKRNATDPATQTPRLRRSRGSEGRLAPKDDCVGLIEQIFGVNGQISGRGQSD